MMRWSELEPPMVTTAAVGTNVGAATMWRLPRVLAMGNAQGVAAFPREDSTSSGN